MCENKRSGRRPRPPKPASCAVVNPRTGDEPGGLQQAIGEYLFTIAATDRPDAARRWDLVVEHIAAWLLDEWEHERRDEHGKLPAQK